MFLLIAFALNVASLNIEKDPSSLVDLFADVAPMLMNKSVESPKKDPSSLVELLADVAPMHMNESVESLKKDPSSFVELFAGADPGVINQVIGLLETLVSEAVSSLDNLENRKTETSNNLNTANTELVTAQDALEEANTAKSNAENAETAAQLKRQTAEVEKDLAQRNYDEQSPNLNEEKRVLQEVIEQLLSISDGYSKSDCRRPYSNNVLSVGDYGSYNGSGKTLDECQDLCAQTPDCKSFVVDQMGGMKCHLKSECPLRSEACIDGSSWKFINYYENSCE